MTTDSKQFGLGALELIMLVAILSLLVAIALPAYQDHRIRSNIKSMLDSVARTQSFLNYLIEQQGSTTGVGTGLRFKNFDNVYISRGKIHRDGSIDLLARGSEMGTKTDITITLTPSLANDGHVQWRCASNAPKHHLPRACNLG